MLNAEKYKEAILRTDYNFSLQKNGYIMQCTKLSCNECQFQGSKSCVKAKFRWLLEEYKEPILTDAEKAYLKSTITHLKKDDYLISKQERNGIDYICIVKVIGDYRYDVVLDLNLNYFKFKFNGMTDYCWYELEKLEL